MNDLIKRRDVIGSKAEFLNEQVIRETEAQTSAARSYAKGWNQCNRHWIDAIKELPPAHPYTDEEIQKMQDIAKAELQKAYELGKEESEVIRCKDCKWWRQQVGAENRGLGTCSFHNTKYVIFEGYCYWAERRK